MMIELLTQDNYISFNIKAAHILGLTGAVYCSELFNIYSKASRKAKITEDGFFKVDRKYIADRTTISIEDQLVIDLNWIKLSIMEKKPDNPDSIKIDFKLLLSILSDNDTELLSDVKKKLETKSPRGVKETKRQAICNNLKNGIICTNEELLTALRDWVDAIFSNPTGYLSKKSIEIFQQTLNNYTGGDLDLALNIVKIATANGYRDCSWAINSYEKSKQMNSIKPQTSQRMPRVTEQKRATKDDVGPNIF
jgi:hypothetical protein